MMTGLSGTAVTQVGYPLAYKLLNHKDCSLSNAGVKATLLCDGTRCTLSKHLLKWLNS